MTELENDVTDDLASDLASDAPAVPDAPDSSDSTDSSASSASSASSDLSDLSESNPGADEAVLASEPEPELEAVSAPAHDHSADLTSEGATERAAERSHDRATERANEMAAVFEAILFTATEPVPRERLLAVFNPSEAEAARGALDVVLERHRRGDDRGIMLEEVAGGLRLATRPELHSWLRRFYEAAGANKLSMAALETLAIVAYRQPVTGPEIQDLRSVSATGVLKTLLDRRLIRIAGRKPVVGKPFLYSTTREFLMHFGLRDLQDLPPLEEFEETFGDGGEGVGDGGARLSAAFARATPTVGDGNDGGRGLGEAEVDAAGAAAASHAASEALEGEDREETIRREVAALEAAELDAESELENAELGDSR